MVSEAYGVEVVEEEIDINLSSGDAIDVKSVGIEGPPGPQPELRIHAGMLQWRPIRPVPVAWIDLVDLAGYLGSSEAARAAAQAAANAAEGHKLDAAASASIVAGAISAALGYREDAREAALSSANSALASHGAAITAEGHALTANGDRTATSADAASTAADRIATGVDAVSTAADRLATAADASATAADRAMTGNHASATALDALATAADRNATSADAVATAADRLATGADASATATDRVMTGNHASATSADAASTAADRIATGADAVATAADRLATGADASATAADRVVTGNHASATAADVTTAGGHASASAADRIATGADALATAADRVVTGADRVQTGLDRAAAEAARSAAEAAAVDAATFDPGSYYDKATSDGRYAAVGHGHADATSAASGFMAAGDKSKLDAIAAGATVNSSDADLLARANHTGAQLAETISDFSTAADARINAAVGETVQSYSAKLSVLASQTWAANRYIYLTGANTAAIGTITVFGRSLIDDADAAAARLTLGLGSAAALTAGIGANNAVQLDGSARLPAVNASLLTNLPPSPGLGIDQTWQVVSRAVSTSYRNTTGKPIALSYLVYNSAMGAGVQMEVSVNNSTWQRVAVAVTQQGMNSSGTPGTLFAVIPHNHYYRTVVLPGMGGSAEIVTALELR